MLGRSLLIAVALLGIAAAGCDTADRDLETTPTPTPSSSPANPSTTPTTAPGQPTPDVVRVVARGLQVPWGVTFLPDGTALVGERDTTRVWAIEPSGAKRVVGRVEEAVPREEAGLLGLAASPDFARNRQVFAYISTATDNRVVRFTYRDGALSATTPVLTGIPNGFIHDGGRLLFDDDGNLFVSTGETGDPELAQDKTSLAGKILHITPDGKPAPGNPFPGSPVYSLGHRNVQGLAIDGSGQLWASEFGQNTWDELNQIEPGGNYGWPQFEGKGGQAAKAAGFRDPSIQWRTDKASPSGLAYADGCLWLGALRGERLWRACLDEEGIHKPKAFFVGDYGRMRSVVVTPSGDLWVTTSNRDGRGDPRPGDDKILLVRV
ncbi:MAG: PQQ-dependent sugar dehydrogenase [Nocardioidaceae bacterium]